MIINKSENVFIVMILKHQEKEALSFSQYFMDDRGQI